ncbi:hypothetical protein AVEN_257775-1 [Araneus ventricosus]|uniref:ATP-dependent DNA helicase n=1 Tax=Araneus ventricosus TaxID=182803 RepID=A0A4Y2KB84_ARAVE|nr:hypothetical protein AVEN_257775-1 [Araneus ventricosus]
MTWKMYFRNVKIIVWDECTMASKAGVEDLDRTLQGIRNCNCLIGGVTVILAGDFGQTLPVVPRGTRDDEVRACLKSSYLWSKVSMRVILKGNIKAEEFPKLQLNICDGKF